MANKSHLQRIAQGVSEWNDWRTKNPIIEPDLSEANLSKMNLQYIDLHDAILTEVNLAEADLTGANLKKAKLRRAKLMNAIFHKANLDATLLANASLCGAQLNQGCKLGGASLVHARLTQANLQGAILRGADLTYADLCGADLSGAHLFEANLSNADLTGADLCDAELGQARLVETIISNAVFTRCAIYGVSVWNLQGEPKDQSDLNISDLAREPTITVDNLYVAQFIYLLIHYPELNKAIDTITSKVVLILGRFSDARKPTLDAMRDALRDYDLVPVMFDFDRPSSKTLIDTVSTLANMARFVVADFTDPKIVLQEAPKVVETSVVLQPILLKGAEEPVTLTDLRAGRTTVLPTFEYENDDDLISSLKERIIKPANDRVEQLIAEKQKAYEAFERKRKEEEEGRGKPPISESELAELKERGILTEEEFQKKRRGQLSKP